MSRFFETIEVEEDIPKYLIVGSTMISRTLVDNLISGGAKVYVLSSLPFLSKENLFQINDKNLDEIPSDVRLVFFEKNPDLELERLILGKFPDKRKIYLNPKMVKKNSVMIFSSFIYGEEIVDEAYGFLAFNEKNILVNQEYVLPENFSDEIAPVYFLDVIEEIEKSMFSLDTLEEELIMLQGPEKISIISFFEQIKSKLKFELKMKSLSKKLVLKLPIAGRIAKGRIGLTKGLQSTVQFLNTNFQKKENLSETKPATSFDDLSSDRLTTDLKNIPIVSSEVENEKNLTFDNTFIKKLYRENIDYLEKNNLKHKPKQVFKHKTDFRKFVRSLFKNRLFFSFDRTRGKLHVVLQVGRILMILMILFFLPLFVYFSSLMISLFSFRQTYASMKSLDLKKITMWENVTKVTFSTTKFLHINLIKFYFIPFKQEKAYDDLTLLLSLQEDGLKTERNIKQAYMSFIDVVPYMLRRDIENENVDSKIQTSIISVHEAKNNLASIIATLKNRVPSLPFLLRFKNQEYFDFLKTLPGYYRSMNDASVFIKSLPEMVGLNAKKTYMILFQNNMELRSTGGFIGSFALVTFEKYKLTDFSVYDVYDADGQLKGHVDPPPEILHYLKQPDWFLRDSNVSPDFPESAERAVWFMAKEMKIKVDGVIAIDISTVEDLLSVLGPIYLSDYKETVTSKNLFEKAERASEVNYFPGSKNKKDFLSVLSKQIWVRINELEKEKILKLFGLMQNAILKKHLQMYFEDQSLQNVSRILQADGQMIQFEGQYLNVIENNYGANKANYFLKRSFHHQIDITEDGYAFHSLKITYSNFSPLSMWPTGDYSPYVKIYTNRDSIFQDLKIDSKKVKISEFLNEYVLQNLKSDSEQLVLQGDDSGYRYFGTFFTVPVGKTKELTFYWQSPLLTASNQTSFRYFFQKQAGVIGDDYGLEISFPKQFKVKSDLAPSVAEKGILKYNLNTEKDINLQLTFN